MYKKCEYCKVDFKVKPSTAHRRKTCSRECYSKHRVKKIKRECVTCMKVVNRTLSEINKNKSGNVFCSNKCVGLYNSKISKENEIIKKCVICNSRYKTIKSREDISIVCSNKCQGIWQSNNRVGENASNYRGGGSRKNCLECDKTFTTKSPYQTKNRKFCSKKCKNSHWVKNTLNDEEFKKSRFEGNRRYQSERRETKPERMVREYLESKDLVKGVDFFQERGFFRKYFADFYIPKNNIIIEVQGDFWHGNPYIYGDEEGMIPLYESQIERIEKDKIKKEDFISRGFSYYEIWESDIYEDIEKEFVNIDLQ